MNNNDKLKAKEIALNAAFKSNYSYDEISVRYGADKMCEYKNEEFKQLLRKHQEEFVNCGDWDGWGTKPHFEVEDFIKTYLEN